jgi:hypothetical protein
MKTTLMKKAHDIEAIYNFISAGSNARFEPKAIRG